MTFPKGFLGKAWISSGDIQQGTHPTIYFSGIGTTNADNCFLTNDGSFTNNFDHSSLKDADKAIRKDIKKELCDVSLATNREIMQVTTKLKDIVNLTTKSTDSTYKGDTACYTKKLWYGV